MSKDSDIDLLLGTFSKDREFCHAIASKHPFEIARLLVYERWAQLYFSSVQDELYQMASKHFPQHLEQARFWTLALTGGVRKDIGLVPYLTLRGLLNEAGLAVRRGMENVGVLAHLWHDSAKAALLADRGTPKFKNAFESETDPLRQKNLAARGVKKRFENCMMGPALSTLYKIMSEYVVHGGSPSQLVTSEVMPTKFSCGLINRADPCQKDLTTELEILGNGVEMICVETTAIHGKFGKQYGVTPSPGGEGGYFLTLLMNRGPESEMLKLQTQVLTDLGWIEEGDSRG